MIILSIADELVGVKPSKSILNLSAFPVIDSFVSISRLSASPDIDTFEISSYKLTDFDAGKLVPIYVDEVLPGDTFSLIFRVLVLMSRHRIRLPLMLVSLFQF